MNELMQDWAVVLVMAAAVIGFGCLIRAMLSQN